MLFSGELESMQGLPMNEASERPGQTLVDMIYKSGQVDLAAPTRTKQSSTKHQDGTTSRMKSAGRRQPNIRLGSGSGPSSNIFSVRNGKLVLTGSAK